MTGDVTPEQVDEVYALLKMANVRADNDPDEVKGWIYRKLSEGKIPDFVNRRWAAPEDLE